MFAAQNVLEHHGLAIGTAERDSPIRVFVHRSRLVLRARVTDHVGKRDTDQPGWGPSQKAMLRLHGRLHIRICGQRAPVSQLGEPGVPGHGVSRQFLLERSGEQAK